MKRIDSIDSLRGLAIFLMIIDHIALFILREDITLSNIRFLTRVSEPLFTILFGYFLYNRGFLKIVERLSHVLLAAFLSNLIYYPFVGRIEILGSFLLVYVVYILLKERMKYLFLLIFLFPIDPTSSFLDYPLTLVLSQVALGQLIRENKHLIPSVLILFSYPLITPPYNLSLLFTPLALFMVLLSIKNHSIKIPLLSFLGKHPLKSYTAQFYTIIPLSLLR